MTVLCNLQL